MTNNIIFPWIALPPEARSASSGTIPKAVLKHTTFFGGVGRHALLMQVLRHMGPQWTRTINLSGVRNQQDGFRSLVYNGSYPVYMWFMVNIGSNWLMSRTRNGWLEPWVIRCWFGMLGALDDQVAALKLEFHRQMNHLCWSITRVLNAQVVGQFGHYSKNPWVLTGFIQLCGWPFSLSRCLAVANGCQALFILRLVMVWTRGWPVWINGFQSTSN